jgi:hypothetical protein
MSARAIVPLLIATAMLAGCSTTETRSYRLDPAAPALATWNGKPMSKVIEVWGAPTERENDGEGGTILVYREELPVTLSSSTREGMQPPPPGPNASDSTGSVSTQRVTKIRARFWVDAGGTVYRYWFSNAVYEKGDDDLPAPKKPPVEESEPHP